jgi:hypothetical protein
VPALNTAGIRNITNGPTIWAGDGSPRCGPTNIKNYYDFNTLTYGITHGLPLAESVTHGARFCHGVSTTCKLQFESLMCFMC